MSTATFWSLWTVMVVFGLLLGYLLRTTYNLWRRVWVLEHVALNHVHALREAESVSSVFETTPAAPMTGEECHE